MKTINDYLDMCSTYMFIGGLSKDLSDEKKVEDDIILFVHGVEMLPQIKNQVDCDAPNNAGENNYRIDLVIKAADGYLPIELKHSTSATKEEIEEDIRKLEFYTQHYSDMHYGLLIYYSNKKNDPIPKLLKTSPVIDNNGSRFYYQLVRKNEASASNQKTVSFEERWEAKKID